MCLTVKLMKASVLAVYLRPTSKSNKIIMAAVINSLMLSYEELNDQSFLVIDGSLLNKNKRKDWFSKNHDKSFLYYLRERHSPSIRIQE